jgi:hypothetical protein
MSGNRYFNDPTVPDKENRKKAHYWADSDKHINFLSKLRVDGLNQSQFHRAMIEGYLQDDVDLLAFLNRYKEKHTVQGQRKRGIVEAMKKRTADVKRKFGIEKEDIESIFDLIEGETGS